MGLFAILSPLALASVALLLTQVDHFNVGVMLLSAGASAYLTWRIIPRMIQLMLAKGIGGLDLNKKGTTAGEKKIPECLGLASAVAFCMVGLALAPVF
jgi:hypothetical protein